MTHDDLILRAIKWLAGTRKCYLTMDEQGSSATYECPDAIGWRNGGRVSVLVECKVSVSDFHADKKKMHRKRNNGMGSERWYMTPPGLLKPEQIPEGWGLVEAGPRCRTILTATPRPDRDWQGEMALLISAHVGNARNKARVYAPLPDEELQPRRTV